MFRHILLPLDGTRQAELALPVAARLARATEGEVILMQVIDPTHTLPGMRLSMTMEERIAAGRSYLEQVRKRAYLSGLITQTVVIAGRPAPAIAAEASLPKIDLLVLASHDVVGVKHWLQGSVAEDLACFATVPILWLQDRKLLHIHRRIDGTSFVRVLVPLDLTAPSLAAVVPAARLASAFSTSGEGEVHLAHVVVSRANESMPDLETRLEVARETLEAIGQGLKQYLQTSSDPNLATVTLTWAVTMETEVAQGIARRAEHGEKHAGARPARTCDLIVMATHVSSGRQKWGERSTTGRVLHATHLPLVVVHTAEDREQQEQRTSAMAEKARG